MKFRNFADNILNEENLRENTDSRIVCSFIGYRRSKPWGIGGECMLSLFISKKRIAIWW